MQRLNVPYHSQMDNASGRGWEECFSSSVAMVAQFYGRVDGDDAYNRVRARIGDTKLASSHVGALRSLGLRGTFSQRMNPDMVIRELSAGRPCCLGWLHHGPILRPRGGGHWFTVIGADRDLLLVHDPAGEPDLLAGGHIPGRSGRAVLLTWRNFRRRWEIEGPGHGWGLTVEPPFPHRPAG